ncbi:SRPBCC family protein [Allosalinactinospora lopnorensis]|uniref:SRPBCC family protein n=1 Tax=Allosalinactinospora lopnorensis TaxID=1352348 RepID=UPI000623F3AB|nr:SRPBCC family protein [Allosalinactinospora lopnorensis]
MDTRPLTAQVEVRIAAAPERVWEFASDIAVPARFSGELQQVEWLDGAEAPRVGARFTGRNRNKDVGEWSTTCELVEVHPPQTLAWQVLGADEALATWRFDLIPDGPEATLLRHRVRTGPGRTPLDDFIARRPDKKEKVIQYRRNILETNMRATAEGIRGLAEGTEYPAGRTA